MDASSSTGSATPLAGLRVVDFTQIASGPVCTLVLADLGADVIKIEPPTGDTSRTLGPPWIDGVSTIYLALNRNKRGIVLDLKKPDDVERARRLVADADVLVENFRPGVMDRLGLGWKQANEMNPRLVYCSISAYGQEGPWRHRAGVDGVLQAVSGLMSLAGEEGGGPIKVSVPILDIVTGFLASSAVQAALLARNATGLGRHVDISMLASSLMLQQTAIAGYFASGELPAKTGSAAPYAAPNEAFPTRDGWIMIAAYQQDRWRKLCDALRRSELVDDTRFAALADRVANRPALVAELAATLKNDTTTAWVERLEAADVLCAPIADYASVAGLEQARHNGIFVDVPHPTRGTIRQVGCNLGARGADVPVRYAAPSLGEHNAAIFGGSRAEVTS
ncbi:CaiB/BaiF CoA transferase family protein [Ramlibacter sp.]|uniref:CaiB/BaiF CoA transferase family protein n=1 Tax=Ramlibacter sp. TaxID=1917967 RepID=UPI003D0EE202